MKLDLTQLLGEKNAEKLKGVPLGLIFSGLVLAANLGFWGLMLPDIEAQTEALTSQQNQLNSQISGLDRKIADLKKSIAGLKDLTDAYNREAAKGSFEPENRLKANDILADLKTRHSGLDRFDAFSEYRLEIKPGAPYTFAADGKSQTWFASPVTVNIEMLHDRFFYEFAYDALGSLNGVSLLKTMNIERRGRDLQKDLEGKDKNAKLALPITAELEFLWVTQKVPEDSGTADKAKRR
ncbi:MAG: hypothetical protein HQL45_11160 [Alphaproteobacteria bacterium]|nr:hypothetical protein [Alphaproteobacteria bacterium]